MHKPPKRPRDPAQLAKLIVDIATGEVEDAKPKSANDAQRAAGLKGAAARAIKLDPERRHEISSKAAKSRWEKARAARETIE